MLTNFVYICLIFFLVLDLFSGLKYSMLEIIQICYDISEMKSSRNANLTIRRKRKNIEYLLGKDISCSVVLSILYTDWNRIHTKVGTALRWLMQTWFVTEKSIRWDNKINLKLAFSILFQVLQTLLFSSIDYISLLHGKSPEFYLLSVICNSLVLCNSSRSNSLI